MSAKAVIYARYSSDNQRDASIDQQVKECRKYAELMGYEIIKVYDDRALTGKTDKRPSFLRMIRDSAKGDFKYVIVYALDRFSRNKYDSAIYKQKLK
jgi:DNA invertase Pin-like site-specific DNA recombinase